MDEYSMFLYPCMHAHTHARTHTHTHTHTHTLAVFHCPVSGYVTSQVVIKDKMVSNVACNYMFMGQL